MSDLAWTSNLSEEKAFRQLESVNKESSALLNALHLDPVRLEEPCPPESQVRESERPISRCRSCVSWTTPSLRPSTYRFSPSRASAQS